MKSKDVDEVVAIVNGSATYYEVADTDGEPLAVTLDREWATRVAAKLGFKVIPRGTPQN